jgi:hypothetical protein
MQPDQYAEFLKYNYPETKDLCKHFITVVTTVLTVSLTFSDKVVGFAKARPTAQWLLIVAWSSMLSAIIACGAGLVYNARAGGQAMALNRIYMSTAQVAYSWIVVAGCAFVLGLMALIATVVLSMRPASSVATPFQTPGAMPLSDPQGVADRTRQL